MTSDKRPLNVVWFSSFPMEWLPDAPEAVAQLPKLHPTTWQRVLLDEFKGNPDLALHVITFRKEVTRDVVFRRDGVTFRCLRIPRGWWRALSGFWIDTWRLRRELRRINPDVIHAWGTEQGAALAATRLHYPALVTMQGLMKWYAQRVRLNRYERLAARLEQASLRRTKWVTTESRFSVSYLREHYPHLEIIQAEHAANWRFHRLQRRPETQTPRFLFVGTFDRRKGLDLLVQALGELQHTLDFRVCLVGSGKFLSALQTNAPGSLWQRVEVRQNVEPAAVAEEVARATMLIFPTRADTSPNAVKEAVVAGLPVIASAVGGIVDYVFPGRNGFTVEPDNAAELSRGVVRALAHPLFRAGAVDPDTLAEVRAYLSPRVMAETFYEAYRRVWQDRSKF